MNFRELWESGEPVKIIAKLLGMTESGVSHKARRAGLTMRRKSQRIAPQTRAAIKRALKRTNGKRIAYIAAQYGVSYGFVWRVKHPLDRRRV